MQTTTTFRSETLRFFVIIFVLLCGVRESSAKEFAKDDKGLFLIQFSWDPDSYPRSYEVGLLYKKTSKLALLAEPSKASAKKNSTLALELAPATYQIIGIEFYSSDLNGKKISIGIDKTFTITSGQVTNGGLAFIIKDPGSSQVMVVSIDNQKDATWYAGQYHKKYAANGITPGWKFVENEKIDKLRNSYENLIVTREKARPRRPVKYIYGVLGLLVKLDKAEDGTVNGYKTIETNTYQEITRATAAKDKLLFELGQGQYLYGTSEGVSLIPLPEDVEDNPRLFMLDADKFIVLDNNINIYSSVGPAISWKKQGEYRNEVAVNPQFNIPYLSYGPDKMYLYTTGPNKFKKMWYSGYDEIHFKPMETPEEIKRIPDVIATKNKLIIGPITSNLVKNQASIYVKEGNSETWQLVAAPRGDCDVLLVDEKDENKYDVRCGLSKNRTYRSTDAGKTWTEVE